MDTTRSAASRFSLGLIMAAAVLVTFLGFTTAAAHADEAPTPTPAPTAEVCAPGVMAVTRGGATVLDGVDCTPGAHAAGTAVTSDAGVPSGTVLRPATLTPAAPASGASGASTAYDVASPAIIVLAAFAVAMGLFQVSRRRRSVLAGDDES